MVRTHKPKKGGLLPLVSYEQRRRRAQAASRSCTLHAQLFVAYGESTASSASFFFAPLFLLGA
jgi:hypothetical protein